jgi:hypothetical protein
MSKVNRKGLQCRDSIPSLFVATDAAEHRGVIPEAGRHEGKVRWCASELSTGRQQVPKQLSQAHNKLSFWIFVVQ